MVGKKGKVGTNVRLSSDVWDLLFDVVCMLSTVVSEAQAAARPDSLSHYQG
jgi:hypothetical protein